MKTDKVNDLYNKYANKQKEEVKSETKPAEVEPKAKDETKQEVVEEAKVETGKTNADNTNPDTVKEDVETKPVETETKTEDKPEKKTYSKQEQIDYAFQKLKAKNKKLAARIKELEEESKKKPNNLTLEDFKGNVQDYSDYRTDQKIAEYEKKRLMDEYNASQAEEYDAINNKKITECFPDAVEQEKYRQLVKQEGGNLLKKLDANDPEQAILGFLDDSDVAPILVRIFISKPQYLDNILAKRSPYGKYREMEKLAESVQYAREQIANRNKPMNAEQPKEETKPAIPVIGSVTKSEQHKDSKTVFDANAILHKLKEKNKYHK